MSISKSFKKSTQSLFPHKDSRILLAISGGIDSMVLLSLAHRFLSGRFAVAHIDHGTRGNESKADARFVRSVCVTLDIPLHETALVNVGPSEDSLRKARKAYLLSVAEEQGYSAILTAHHADDVLETLLMRLIRGTGLTGLGSIAPKSGKFVRPLISVSRRQIDSYAARHRITFRQDTSNHSLLYYRNRVRHQLVPQMKKLSEDFGGEEKLLKRTVKLTRELRMVQREIDARVKGELQAMVVRTPFFIRLPQQALKGLRFLERSTLVRLLLKELGQATDQRTQVEALQRFLMSDAREWTLGRVKIQRSLGFLYFTGPSHRETPAPTLRFSSGRLVCEALGFTAQVDARYQNAVARFPKPGDRIGQGKLKKRLLEWRIPEPERRLLPLLVDTGSQTVFWHFPETNGEVVIRELKFPFAFRPERS